MGFGVIACHIIDRLLVAVAGNRRVYGQIDMKADTPAFGVAKGEEPGHSPVVATPESLGVKVKALRKRRRWTLTELSEQSGISASTLSKIERDKLSPTYANLVRLARGLRVNTSELFGGSDMGDTRERMSIMRLGEGDAVETRNYLHHYLHMKLDSRAMTPLIVDHRARTLEEFGPLVSHPGEEFVYVLSGIIEIHIGDNPPVTLNTGESIYFDSSMPHAYLAASRYHCMTLAVCSDLSRDDISRIADGV
jgi:transcriptional regulator with XRE-family HTH domain